MSTLRPHDLLRLSAAAADLLPNDAPSWTRVVLRTSPWVVVRRAAVATGFVPVGIRGVSRPQRYAWSVMPDLVRETVTPEDLTVVDPQAGRDVPAMRTLAAVRAVLREMDAGWGPTGSVGFELATGIATATLDSDLDLVVRAPALTSADFGWLVALHRRLVGLEARVDCQVDTRAGAIALVELVSDTDDVLVKTPAGPRLVERAVAVR